MYLRPHMTTLWTWLWFRAQHWVIWPGSSWRWCWWAGRWRAPSRRPSPSHCELPVSGLPSTGRPPPCTNIITHHHHLYISVSLFAAAAKSLTSTAWPGCRSLLRRSAWRSLASDRKAAQSGCRGRRPEPSWLHYSRSVAQNSGKSKTKQQHSSSTLLCVYMCMYVYTYKHRD